MARRVTVSSLGQSPPPFPHEEKHIDKNVLINNMIAFWTAQIGKVLPDRPDLIVLPEMCDRYLGTPFEAVLLYRREMGERMVQALQRIAAENNCYIVYSGARVAADDTWRNAAVMIDRAGQIIGQYNKNHTVVTEIKKGILCGATTPIIECDFGTVGFVICFDLNFEELRLKYAALKPDLLVFPSMYHGGLMEAYWAYSCRAHFVGCMGFNNLPNEFYSPVGNLLATSTNYYPNITTTLNLDCAVAHLDFNWERFTALKKKYGRDVTIYDPGKLGAVLITSESDEVDVQTMIKEFEIELLDDYMARSLEHHHAAANRESATV